MDAPVPAGGITLTNGGGGLYVIAPGDLTFSAVVGGVKVTYRNTSGGTLNPGPGTTLDLDIEANEAGTASNATPGQIDTLETTCANGVSVLGQDQELDPDLRQRCRDKLGLFSSGGAIGAQADRSFSGHPPFVRTLIADRSRETGFGAPVRRARRTPDPEEP